MRARLGRRITARAVLCLSMSIAALTASRDARADARTEARTHFKAGMEAIAQGRYEQGIAELTEAYEILPHPNVLYNIARAHAESGNLEQAVSFFRKYLDGNPPDKDEVSTVVKNLEARIRRQRAAKEAAESPAPDKPAPDKPAPDKPAPDKPAPDKPAPDKPAPDKPVEPPSAQDLGKARTEDVFEETVVTASKGAQQTPLEASNSTSIITEQDIRLSGITKIPELLRRLAGVEVMQTTGAQTEVSIRGFNQRLSNKVLVLVDGRSVYVDLLGATFWQTLSIGVEDIARIEVVRGPGSALYGADAFGGVINIITKKPGEGGGGIAGGYGTHATTHGSLWATGRDGDVAWRVAAGYDYVPRWSREVPNGRADLVTGVGDQVEAGRTTRIDARATRAIGKVGTLGVGGGFSQGALEVLGVGLLNDIVLPKFAATDLTTYFEGGGFLARVFWNRLRADNVLNAQYVGQSLQPGRAEQNVVDAEVVYRAQTELATSLSNDFRIGGAYRYKDVSWTFLDRRRVEHHFGLFLHDELRIAKPFAIVADYRIDWVPYLQRFQQSPRGAVLVHPTKASTIRASVATAFRKPTFLESYLRLPVQLPVTGTAQLSESVRTEDPDFRVDAERILSAELGYLNQESDFIVLDTAAYYNRVSNLIQLAQPRALTVGDFAAGVGRLDPQTGFFPVALGGFSNQCQAYDVVGGEAGVRTYPLKGLDVYGSYSLNLVKQDNSSCSNEEIARLVADQRTSMHKVNAGVQLRTKPGFDGSIDFHFVSSQVWGEQVTNVAAQQIEQQRFALPAYTLLNARVGYRFLSNQAEISAVSFNSLDLQHRQHPFGQLLGRRVMGMFTYRF